MQLPPSALSILETGGILVTANARAARDLRRLFGEQRRAEGRRAWASPAILDMHGWLAAEWQRLLLTGTEERLLLTALQEESVWAEVVQPIVRARSLLSPGEVARLSQRAYALLAAYGGSTGIARLGHRTWHLPNHDSGDEDVPLEQELFRGWAQEFERKCERRGWLSSSLLPGVLTEAYRRKQLSTPPAIGWCGFDRVRTDEATLRAALKDAGCAQHDVAWELAAEQWRVSAQSTEHELEACALWVRDTLARRPGVRIGVLVQDVASMRAALDRTFRRVLMPESRGLRAHAEKPVYEFTLGMALADVPMVRAALLLLHWMAAPLEQEEISWLMTTGFFGSRAEMFQLARTDEELRQKELLPPEQEMDTLLQRLSRTRVTAWLRGMQQAKAAMDLHLTKARSCRQWAASVDAVLSVAGWPGEQMQDGVAYQVRERWQRALQEVAALDFAEVRVSFSWFLDHLKHHAGASIFSAASQDAPVSISGVAESAGRAFDAVWMLQATDEAWPTQTSSNAMLPGWLQAELNMPRGDAQEDSAFCAAVAGRMRTSSHEVVFSYAREGLMGAQRPSALIAGLREEEMAAYPSAGDRFLTEEFADVETVPWQVGVLAHGGSRTLKLQAACPFQAFAAKRLGGQDIRDSEHGFDARQHGNLVHAVMETLWDDDRMKDSAGLKHLMFSQELSGIVRQHVSEVLARYRQDASSWELEYLALEEQRLCQLIDALLQYESRRAAFVVEQMECKQEIEIAGLRLSVRMDRIDKLEHGRILIDYKTGEAVQKQWMGERPDEPQLPLYAVAGKVDELRDVYFARVRRSKKDPCFIGALSGDDCGVLRSTNETYERDSDFERLLDQWRVRLEALSLEFQAGVAAVSPKDGAKTCKHCPFSGLCRVAETSTEFHNDDDDAESEPS